MESPLRVGIVGCGEGTHGKVWGELLARPDGARFGMKPVWVWDSVPVDAQALADASGASVVRHPASGADQVDGVLITELMPYRYLTLARPFLEKGMRVFLNRPFAGSVDDAHEIVRLAARHGAKVYSASALYHTQAALKAREELKRIQPLRLFNVTGASDHIGYYLPHAIAAMSSVLGTGVAKVRSLRLTTKPEDPHHAAGPVVIFVEYGADASVGPACGTVQMIGPGSSWYGFSMSMFGAHGEAEETRFKVTYDHLLETMAGFFRTGEEPVPREAILEQTCVFYAALASGRKSGACVDVGRMLKPEGR